jgi:hypothetical protein
LSSIHAIRNATRFTAAVLAIALEGTLAIAGPEELYDRGVREFSNGSFQKAAVDLKESLDGHPSTKTALYLGNAYLQLGKLDEAKAAFQTVLRLDPNHPKKAALETLIASIDARAEIKLHVESTPSGATVRVDTEASPRGTTPLDVTVVAGRHKIAVERSGYETVTKVDTFSAGSPTSLSFTLEAACDVSLAVKGPSFARAVIDGGPPIDLPTKVPVRSGQHEIVFTGAGYVTQRVPLECNGAGAMSLEPALEPQNGKLVVPQAPGTVVTVDGKVVDMTPAEATNLPAQRSST